MPNIIAVDVDDYNFAFSLPGNKAGLLELESVFKPTNILKKLNIYLPTLNSIRKVCSKPDQVFAIETLL